MSVFTKEKRKKIIEFVDDLVKSPWWLEPYDQIFVGWGFDYIDETYGDKVPEKFHDDINNVSDAVLEGRWEDVVTLSTPEFLTNIVKIPGVDEDTRAKMVLYNVKTLYEFIRWYAKKKISEKE